ncbi:hypothetical protein IJM86_04215 [bacterium]|nr:hypothetical protein [bacterium]
MGKINEYLKLMEEDGEYNSHVKSLPRYPNDVFTPPPLQALLGNTDP